jgi:hypothetical protein
LLPFVARHEQRADARLVAAFITGPGLLDFPAPYAARYVAWTKARANQNRGRTAAKAQAATPKGPPSGWLRKLLDDVIVSADDEGGEPCED